MSQENVQTTTTHQTVVVVQQPAAGAAATPGAPQNVREWSSGMLSCCDDIGACVCAWFCMPCNLCSIAGRMQESFAVPLCAQGGIYAMRVKLRTQFGIRGSLCGDWAATTCCTPCAVCQIDRELTHVGL